MNQIEQMFTLQKLLNDETNGEVWLTGVTRENRRNFLVSRDLYGGSRGN